MLTTSRSNATSSKSLVSAGLLLAVLASTTYAQQVELRVTAQNLSPANSLTFAPLRVGFHNGTFDVFNNGEAATAPIISIAEGGSGVDWFPAFAAQQPNGTSGTVANGGPLLPGATASQTFIVDPSINRYFTFASMVVPSNDHFIGNDSPLQYELFDSNGVFVGQSISQFGRQIWDAGSELTDPANAAFLVGGINDNRTPENGVVNFNFDQLAAFNGLETAAGYTFDLQVDGGTEIYRISFEVIPSPATAGVFGMAGLVATRRRR